MQTYEIIVKERSVRPNSKDMTLIRTSIGIDKVHILFDNEEWLDFPISCTFAQGPDVITIPLTVKPLRDSEWVAEAECVVPYEVIDMTGSIRVTLQGTSSDGRHIITAKGSPLSVEEAGDVLEGIAPAENPTIDEWQQVYADAQEAVNDAREALDDIDDRIADAIRDALDAYEPPESYVLPTATDERLGGVKIGYGIGLNSDGTIFVSGGSGSGGASAGKLDRIAKIVDATIGAEYDDDGELESTTIKTPSIPPATLDAIGGVIPDGVTVTVDDDGMIHAESAYIPVASESELGIVRPDGTTIMVDPDGTIHGVEQVPIATTESAGKVRPDGTTIFVDEDGTIHGADQAPIATVDVAGKVKPDGTTITVDEDGTIHSVDPITNVDKTRDPYWALVRHDGRTRLAIVIPEVT